MKARKIIAALLVVFMLLTMFSGCKSTDDQEENAFNDEYVTGDTNNSGDTTTDEPNTNEPSTNEPTTNEPTTNEPTTNEPSTNTPSTNEPTTNEPTTNNPSTNEPTTNEPTTDEPTTDEPAEDEVKVEYDEANFLKVMDYNIRCANDGSNKMIADRAPRLKAIIEKYDPDIIGLQEAVPEWISYLEQNVTTKYEMRYKYRAESSLECTPLLWKRDKFELLEEGYYWLSDTPDVESLGWGAKHYRICNWVKLKVKATGKIFIFVNTHLQGGTPAVNSAPLIAKRTKQVGGFTKYPVILTGDFNYAPWSDGYGAFIMEDFIDLNDALGFNNAYTNNGYNERPDDSKDNSIKDYIMYAGDEDMIHPFTYKILNENYYDGWISDHRGLYGEFALL